MRITLLGLLIWVFSFACYAQSSKTGNWFVYFGNQKISPKINFHNEIQYRNYNLIGDINQLLIRVGIGYDLSKNNNNLLLGYGYIQSHFYDSTQENKYHTNEHRIFQQYITKTISSGYYFLHRFRLEERFIPNDLQYRFRYFLSVNKPLNNKTMQPKTIYASAYNEIFVNTANQLFDRNRIYGGVGYVFHKDIKAEFGFMMQSTLKKNQQQFQVTLFNNFSY